MWILFVTTWLWASATAPNAQWVPAVSDGTPQIHGVYYTIGECHGAERELLRHRRDDQKIHTECRFVTK